MSASKHQSFLPYKSVDIYFIFSFVLDLKGQYQNLASNCRKHIQEQVRQGNQGGERHSWIEGIPEDRQGRPPFLTIKRKPTGRKIKYVSNTFSSLRLPKTTAKLCYQEKKGARGRDNTVELEESVDVDLEAWARIFDNGAGSITFRVSLDRDVDFRRIYEILSLSQRLHDKDMILSRFKLEGGNAEELHQVFVRLLRDFVADINNIIEGEGLVTLQDEEIMDLDGEEEHAQNPYVLSVVELDIADEKLLHEPADESMSTKELAAILFRLVYPRGFFDKSMEHIATTRIPYGLLNEDGYLRNFAWDSRVLMCFSQTSSLLACLDKQGVPAKIIRRSMLDTLEILRTRWHMSILINAQLDVDLEGFKLEASPDNLNALKRLIARRKRFASFLHDPLPYGFEGGSVSRLAAVAQVEMQLPELRRMTIEKFDTLDRLHEDQMRYVKLREFDSYLQEIEIPE